MSRYILDTITKAPKQGFSSPDASWFKGDSIDFVRTRLLNNRAPIYDLLDYKATTGLVQEHLDGKQNSRLLIWSLLNVDEWMRKRLKFAETGNMKNWSEADFSNVSLAAM